MALRNLSFALFSATALAAVPGSILNLTSYTLQTPYASGSTIVQIKNPQLQRYNDSTFYAAACTAGSGSCVYFFTPEDGAHTSGSSYPRSELRQNFDWSTPAAGSKEAHWSAATLAVLNAGSADSVCIGQIHADGISGHCSIIVELECAWGGGRWPFPVVAHQLSNPPFLFNPFSYAQGRVAKSSRTCATAPAATRTSSWALRRSASAFPTT